MIGYLLPYHYFKGANLDQLAESAGRPDLKFFADSGAYTAATLGVPIDLNEYAVWLRQWQHRLDPYANLDVLFDVEASAANQRELEKLGLHPAPVWHLGEPVTVLREMVERHDFVAVGNMVSAAKRNPKLWNLLDLVHTIAADNDCGLHGFGLSSWPMIVRWPWRSVDSSSVGASFRYGRITVFDFYAKRWRSWNTGSEQAWHENGWLVREYGFDPAEFAGRTTLEQRLPMMRLAGATWARANEEVPDTNIYLVDSAHMSQGETRVSIYESGVRHQLARSQQRSAPASQ